MTDLAGRVAQGWRRATLAALALVAAHSAGEPTPLAAQSGAVLGVRAGAGRTDGSVVYTGQIELVDTDGTSSVEIAAMAWSGLRSSGPYTTGNLSPSHAHAETLRVWGGGVMGSYLWRHSRRAPGPYLQIGLGVGPVRVDWRVQSTDPLFGTPLPGGGSVRAEKDWTIGTLTGVGIGQRLLDRWDVRAQMLLLLVPSTDAREDMKKLPLFTLSSGVGL